MILHGKDLRIVVNDNGESVIVAGVKSCSIDVECDEIEISSSTSSKWKEYMSGRMSWQINLSFLVMTGTTAADVLKEGTTVSVKVKDGGTGSQLTGTAFFKTYHVEGTTGNLSQGTFVLRGTGALS